MKPLIKVQNIPLGPDRKTRRAASPRPAAPAARRIPAAPTPTAAPPAPAAEAEPATLLSDTAERLALDWNRGSKPNPRLKVAPEADFTAGEPGRRNPLYDSGEKKPPKWLGKSF